MLCHAVEKHHSDQFDGNVSCKKLQVVDLVVDGKPTEIRTKPQNNIRTAHIPVSVQCVKTIEKKLNKHF